MLAPSRSGPWRHKDKVDGFDPNVSSMRSKYDETADKTAERSPMRDGPWCSMDEPKRTEDYRSGPSRLKKVPLTTANLRGAPGENDDTFAVIWSDGPTSRRSSCRQERGNR